MSTQYRKVTLMQGNTEIASKFVKFVDGKNVETIDFRYCGIFTNIVVSPFLPIV